MVLRVYPTALIVVGPESENVHSQPAACVFIKPGALADRSFNRSKRGSF